LAITIPLLLAFLTALNFSDHGFSDLLALTESVDSVHNFLEDHVNPTLGNTAVAALLVDFATPAVVPLAALLTPATTGVVESFLAKNGYDEQSLKAALERKLGGLEEVP